MLRTRTSLFVSSTKATTTTPLISYLTDVEGCYDYWDRFLTHSKVLHRPSKKSNSNPNIFQHNPLDVDFRPEIPNNSHFVFGGDAFDKGNGDIRFFRDLISLQNRYPDRVHFVLGNRDTNKLKLNTEMDLQYRDKFTLPCPYYLPPQAFVSYQDFVAKLLAQHENKEENIFFNNNNNSCSSTATITKDEKDQILLLKYLLKHRMGSGELFEFRRQELALGFDPKIVLEEDFLPSSSNIKKIVVRDPKEVSDMEVVESFKIMANPNSSSAYNNNNNGGIYAEFVKRGKLAIKIGDTVFVHGSINDGNIGLIPELSVQEKFYQMKEKGEKAPVRRMMDNTSTSSISTMDVDEWFSELEKFKSDSLEEIKSQTGYYLSTSKNFSLGGSNNNANSDSSSHYRRGGSAFFGYGHNRCIGDATVEVSTYVQNGEVQHLGPSAALYLSMNGIRRVAVGHQPIGDTPLLIQQPGDVTVVMADVSYGDKPNLRGPNGRGESITEVLFEQEEEEENESEGNEENEKEYFGGGNAHVHGFTSQGDSYHFDIHHPLSGLRGTDGWWLVGASASSKKNNDGSEEEQQQQNKKVLIRKTKDAFKNYEQKWIDHNEANELLASIEHEMDLEHLKNNNNNSNLNSNEQQQQQDFFVAPGVGKYFSEDYIPESPLPGSMFPKKVPPKINKESSFKFKVTPNEK